MNCYQAQRSRKFRQQELLTGIQAACGKQGNDRIARSERFFCTFPMSRLAASVGLRRAISTHFAPDNSLRETGPTPVALVLYVLMIDHAGGQADCRSSRCACEIGCHKGRHMTNFFQSRTLAQKIAAHPALAPSFGACIKLRVGMGERLVGRAFRTSRVKADGTNAMWPQFCCQQAKHRFNSCPCWTKACRVGERNLRNHCRHAHNDARVLLDHVRIDRSCCIKRGFRVVDNWRRLLSVF